MRILQVVPTYFPAVRYGGPIRSVHGLGVALARRGHRVEVATTTLDGDADLPVPTDRPVPLDGVSVNYFRVPVARRLCWSPDLDRFLHHQIGRFDIVHLHSTFLLPTRSAARIARAAGVPFVASPRGMLMRGAIEGRSKHVKRAWIRWVERRTFAEASAVHVTAPLEADELQHAGIRASRVAVIPNGVDYPDDPAAGGPRPHREFSQPYALFLGRVNWKKGLDRLIRAWREVPVLTLVIAGNDEEGYEARMKELARTEGVDARVQFIGPASDAAKWGLYAAASMFVLPSYSENFGNTVVEAMAMRCPVIVSDAVGAAGLVREAGAGFVNSGEPSEVARDVCALLANPALGLDMGRRGREFAAQNLSWAAVAGRMEHAYLDAIHSARGARRV